MGFECGATGVTSSHSFPFSSILHTILQIDIFLCFDKSYFSCPLTLHPFLLSHLAMTNRVKRVWDPSFLSLLPPRVLHVCKGVGTRENIQISTEEKGLSKLMGGGHWQIGLTQKHSSSLPHTCWIVLFGLDSMWYFWGSDSWLPISLQPRETLSSRQWCIGVGWRGGQDSHGHTLPLEISHGSFTNMHTLISYPQRHD